VAQPSNYQNNFIFLKRTTVPLSLRQRVCSWLKITKVANYKFGFMMKKLGSYDYEN
jgi:hypothetical protein